MWQIKLGKRVVDGRKWALERQVNPEFYRVFETSTSLPGDSRLQITMFDKDRFTADDMIGRTEIDLEDRCFDNRWQVYLDAWLQWGCQLPARVH